ncbi:hypothetical protein K438DRAFT_1776301 [Mycena galopus ATCC 62051]|nr:hypothetical protein K438DRAFT_1776301 [Mycena galopus ATCC 62051]
MSFKSIARHAFLNVRLIEDFINQWWGRAGRYPLTFVIRDEAWRDIAHQVLANVPRRYSHRLHYLELYIVENLLPHLGLSSLSFPFLESVSLNLSVAQANAQTVSIFENAPLLHEWHLATFSSIRLILPWLQLTKYYRQPMQDLEIFERAPNLTDVV